MSRKETKYKNGLYRKRVRRPDSLGGGYQDVYGKTISERDAKVYELRQSWGEAEESASSPFVYQYAAAWYRRRAPGLSEQMKDTYARQINKVICPVIGHKRMAEVTPDDIEDVMATRNGMSKSAAKNTLSTLKQIFRAATAADVCRKDPTLNTVAGGKKPQKKAAVTEAVQKRLIDDLAGRPVYPILMLGFYAGLRREETCGLKWDCVHLDGKAPYIEIRRACRWINNHKPEISDVLKSDAAFRSIPIPSQLVDCLTEEKAKLTAVMHGKPLDDLCVIHNGKGQPITYSALRSRWNAVKVRCATDERPVGTVIRNHKITVISPEPITTHILRHTYITRLLLGRVPLKRVQYLAGHADPAVTIEIYNALMEHAPEDLIDDVSGVFKP